jgi:hypothetical protein
VVCEPRPVLVDYEFRRLQAADNEQAILPAPI